jgi:hypothetical protein
MIRPTHLKSTAAVLAALALPATALAAMPYKGGHYSQQRTGRFIVNLDVTPDGKMVTNFSAFTACNPVPFKTPVTIKLGSSGAFRLSTIRKDTLGNAIRVRISGKFVSRGRVNGTYTFSAPGCAGKSTAFSATFQRPQ